MTPDKERIGVSSKRAAGLICAAALGLGSAIGVSACGEDRGGVEVQGGTTATGSTSPSTTPTTTAP